jgi:hypothetical protein
LNWRGNESVEDAIEIGNIIDKKRGRDEQILADIECERHASEPNLRRQ